MDVVMWWTQVLRFGNSPHAILDGLTILASAGLVGLHRITRRKDLLERYVALVEASPHIAYLTNRTGRCIAANQPGCEFFDAMHSEDQDETRRVVRHARRQGRSHEHSIRLRAANGSYRWYLLRLIPLRDKRGTLFAWMGTASDIDNQIRASDSMRFLLDASEAISTSLDVGDNLSTLARVTASSFADYAGIWMRMPDGSIRLVSLAHVDPALHLHFEHAMQTDPAKPPPPIVKRVLEGRGAVLVDVSQFDATQQAQWAPWNAQSLMVVPIDARDQILGALVLTRSIARNPFASQDAGLAMTLAKRAGSAIANAQMFEASCKMAKTLQSAFLPPFLPAIEGLAFEAVYRPAANDAQVGGDWYDVFPLHDGRLALSIGDIMGHGLDAATAMVRIRETIRAAASFDADPSAVLAFANRALCSSEGNGLATAIFAVYDTHSRRLDYAVAGHPKPLLVRNQQSIELHHEFGMVLGIDADAQCSVGTVKLEVGDRIVLYTDGLVECGRDLAEGEQFLRRAVSMNDSAEEVVDSLLADGQSDDVALLTMEIASAVIGEDGRYGWRFHSDDAASATSARPSFASYLSHRGVETGTIAVAELVFGELVSNVVRHAPGPIDINVRFEEGVPVLTVGDRGRGLRVVRGPARLPDDILSEGGRGLFLIERLAGNPSIHTRAGGGSEITVPLQCITSEDLLTA
jgi:PAS domain S-box-containing protein